MNKIVKTLIFADFFNWFGYGLIMPIFAIFVNQNIIGGTLLVIGVAEAIYFGVKAIAQIFIADYLDTEPSDRRNLRWFLFGAFLSVIATAGYLVSRYPWQIYIVEVIYGFGAAIQYPTWYAIFVKHLDVRKQASQIAFHSTIVEVGQALAAAVGGLIASYFDFYNLFIVIGVLYGLAGAALLNLYPPLKQIEKNQMAESTKSFLPLCEPSLSDEPTEQLVVRKYGDPILRDKAKLIKEINDDIRKLAKNMLYTMYKNNGCGLAANQVGILLKLIVLDIGDGPMVLINPKILKTSWQRERMEEGCLSLPGLNIKISRFRAIELEYYQLEDGQKIKIKADHFLARAIQHEIDHLSGILLVDRLMFWQKTKFSKQLDDIEETTKHWLSVEHRRKRTEEKEKEKILKEKADKRASQKLNKQTIKATDKQEDGQSNLAETLVVKQETPKPQSLIVVPDKKDEKKEKL